MVSTTWRVTLVTRSEVIKGRSKSSAVVPTDVYDNPSLKSVCRTAAPACSTSGLASLAPTRTRTRFTSKSCRAATRLSSGWEIACAVTSSCTWPRHQRSTAWRQHDLTAGPPAFATTSLLTALTLSVRNPIIITSANAVIFCLGLLVGWVVCLLAGYSKFVGEFSLNFRLRKPMLNALCDWGPNKMQKKQERPSGRELCLHQSSKSIYGLVWSWSSTFLPLSYHFLPLLPWLFVPVGIKTGSLLSNISWCSYFW